MASQDLNNTITSEIANSYVDLPTAAAYWASDYRTALSAQWAALTSAQQTGLLIDATRIIETIQFTLPNDVRDYVLYYDRRSRLTRLIDRNQQPFKFYYNQKLQFPRNLDVYVLNPPTPELMGAIYVPEDVMEAQCEQAMFLLNFDDTTYASRLMGVVKEQVGVGKGAVTNTEEYNHTGSLTMLAPRAIEKLKPYMIKGGRRQRS